MTSAELRRLVEDERQTKDAARSVQAVEWFADNHLILATLLADIAYWLGGNTMRHHEFVADWLARFSEVESS